MSLFDAMDSSALSRRSVLRALGAAGVVAMTKTVPADARTPTAAVGKALSGASDESSEQQLLQRRAGHWDVTETTWAKPGAPPLVQTGAVAERQMVGSLLQEFLRLPSQLPAGAASRIDYLRFNDVSFQWEYVSMDVRADVGIMPARTFTRVLPSQGLELIHDPFVIRGTDGNTPILLRMKSVITHKNADEDTKDQYFATTDGTGQVWLAHRYAYSRKR